MKSDGRGERWTSPACEAVRVDESWRAGGDPRRCRLLEPRAVGEERRRSCEPYAVCRVAPRGDGVAVAPKRYENDACERAKGRANYSGRTKLTARMGFIVGGCPATRGKTRSFVVPSPTSRTQVSERGRSSRTACGGGDACIAGKEDAVVRAGRPARVPRALVSSVDRW